MSSLPSSPLPSRSHFLAFYSIPNPKSGEGSNPSLSFDGWIRSIDAYGGPDLSYYNHTGVIPEIAVMKRSSGAGADNEARGTRDSRRRGSSIRLVSVKIKVGLVGMGMGRKARKRRSEYWRTSMKKRWKSTRNYLPRWRDR